MRLARNASSIEERSSIEISGPDGDKKPTILSELSSKKGSDSTWGFGNIGTESPVKPSSATIAALYELFLVSNRIAQWPQFAPRYGFGHRE